MLYCTRVLNVFYDVPEPSNRIEVKRIFLTQSSFSYHKKAARNNGKWCVHASYCRLSLLLASFDLCVWSSFYFVFAYRRGQTNAWMETTDGPKIHWTAAVIFYVESHSIRALGWLEGIKALSWHPVYISWNVGHCNGLLRVRDRSCKTGDTEWRCPSLPRTRVETLAHLLRWIADAVPIAANTIPSSQHLLSCSIQSTTR